MSGPPNTANNTLTAQKTDAIFKLEIILAKGNTLTMLEGKPYLRVYMLLLQPCKPLCLFPSTVFITALQKPLAFLAMDHG